MTARPLLRFHEAIPAGRADGAERVGRASERAPAIAELIRTAKLSMVYQPIADLKTAGFHGVEALVRGPKGTALHMPDQLFAAARQQRVELDLELACLLLAVTGRPSHAGARLFVNLSAQALVGAVDRLASLESPPWPHETESNAGSIVVEITEHAQVSQHDQLIAAVTRLRQFGVRIALDDFGDGRSSLRLWSELRPEYVKIDKYFAQGIHSNGDKLATYRALIQIAEVFDTTIVAEGLEDEHDLVVVRDLGIGLGQGWFVGRPTAEPQTELPATVQQAIHRGQIAVFPERGRTRDTQQTVERLAVPFQPVSPALSNDALCALFRRDEALWAVAIVEDGRPIGLVNRQQFMDRYAKPYHREIYGRKACTLFANLKPLTLDRNTSIDELTSVLTSGDQRYLSEGFIVTQLGQYVGLGTGEQLVRSVTEHRIEAARHANPLTLLPGNIPITTHIARLIDSRSEFAACYCDLDSFKPFNDNYGYSRGDEMIQLAAKLIVSHCDPRRDFVGHVGGDDFVLLLQSPEWEERCRGIVNDFDRQAVFLFDESARARGGIEGEDRDGVMRLFPMTTMSIGVVRITHATVMRAEDVASAAALAKQRAKTLRSGVYVSLVDERLPRMAL